MPTPFRHTIVEQRDTLGAMNTYNNYNADIILTTYPAQTNTTWRTQGGINTKGSQLRWGINTLYYTNLYPWSSLVDANDYEDFKYVFDVYSILQSTPNLLDILEWRYGRYMWDPTSVPAAFEQYTNITTAGREAKNLGRYLVEPSPKIQWGASSFNVSRTLQAHGTIDTIYTLTNGAYVAKTKYAGDTAFEPFRDRVVRMINNSVLNGNKNYAEDEDNTCKWRVDYGFQCNPGLTFSDTFYSSETGLVGKLGLTFSVSPRFKIGDEIVIEMNNLDLNPSYNGLTKVLWIDGSTFTRVIVDKDFAASSTLEGGSITWMRRTNESSTGNNWLLIGWREGFDTNSDWPVGFVGGQTIERFAINATTQVNPKSLKFNLAQGSFYENGLSGNIYLNRTPINNSAQLLINQWVAENPKTNTVSATCSICENPRYFLSNWFDETMDYQPLTIFKKPDGTKIYPCFSLGVLNHSNFWPAYDHYYNQEQVNIAPWFLQSVPTIDTIEWKVVDELDAIYNTYEYALQNNNYGSLKDWRKIEVLMANKSVWNALGDVFIPEGDAPNQKRFFEVILKKKYNPNWTFTDDYNTIIDFTGYNWFDYETEPQEVSPYPFNMQFIDYYEGLDSSTPTAIARMEGPYGSNQADAANTGWSFYDPKTYNLSYGFDYYHNHPHERGTSVRNGWWNSFLRLRTTADWVDNNNPIRCYLAQLSDVRGKAFFDQNAIDGKFCFPAGEYGFDYKFIESFSESVDPADLTMAWCIGNECVYLPFDPNNPDEIHTDITLQTNGGVMYWQLFNNLGSGQSYIYIEPIKIRVHNDIIVAKKKYRLNQSCNNPYIVGTNQYELNNMVKLIWKNRLGSYEFFYFTLDSQRSINIDRKAFNPSQTKDEYGLSSNLIGDRQNYSIQAIEEVVINSDWITTAQTEWLDELLTSTEVYLEQSREEDFEGWGGNVSDFIQWLPVSIIDTRYTYKTQLRDKLFNLSLTIQFNTNINNIV